MTECGDGSKTLYSSPQTPFISSFLYPNVEWMRNNFSDNNAVSYVIQAASEKRWAQLQRVMCNFVCKPVNPQTQTNVNNKGITTVKNSR